MGRRDRKRSYAEFEHDVVPDIGLGATLAKIRELPQHNNLDASGAQLKNNESLHHPPEEWSVVNRTSKKRTKRPKKDAISSATQPDSNKKRDNRPALTYAELFKIQSSLKISDLQSLVIYCLADGTSPQWISVKHHSQVRKAVVLLVPGLERNMFDEHHEHQDVVLSDEKIEQPARVDDANSGASTNLLNAKHKDSPCSGSIRSPDDFLPRVLEAEKLPDPLKPLAGVFGHLWPVKAPGDDKYNKVHSPIHAMLTTPLPKSQERINGDTDLKGSKNMRVSATWKDEGTPITSLLLSSEELQENGYTLHPVFYTSEHDRDFNIQRRQKSKQLAEHGWRDSNVVNLIEADVPDTEIESSSITMGCTVLALDCEMCMVEGGEFALTRISIVNWDGDVVMDDLVIPDKPITDYLTQFSGMTAARLATTTTSLSDIQTRLLNLLTPRTIIIGHSLESDLTALRITHPFVIDTATLYPHPRGPPLKSSLKYLSQKYLNREIQKHHGTVGHDSIEDATACLDLVKQKCEKGLKWGTSEATSESIFKRLSRSSRPGVPKEISSHRTGAIVDHGTSERSIGGLADVHIQCDNDDVVVAGVKRAVIGDDDGASVPGGGVDFIWARLRELGNLRGWIQDNNHSVAAQDGSMSSISLPTAPSPEALSAAVSHTVQNILSIHASLPRCTLFIVYSGTGDRREMARLQKMYWQFKREYATKKWDELSVQWTDVEEQALRRSCVKYTQTPRIVPVFIISRNLAAMFCIRRAAFRALSCPYKLVSTRPRSITTCTSSVLRQIAPVYVSSFQRRFASEEVTQTDPEAEGASVAQHGGNSIASSTQKTCYEETLAPGDANVSAGQQEQPSVSTAQKTESANPEDHRTITSAVSSATESLTANASQAASSVLESTQSARESVADAAAAIGAGAVATDAIGGRNTSRKSTSEAPLPLYVGNLFFDVTEEKLKKEMERFGPVKNVKIIFDGRGLSKGFGYVEYEEAASADKAIENLNQQVFEGRRMTVQYSIRKERASTKENVTRNPPAKTLFIGNMSFEMTDKDLNDLFREIKNVIDVRVAIDRRTGQPRGFAHADFIDVASAENARKMLENKEIYGRRLRIDYSNSSVTRT